MSTTLNPVDKCPVCGGALPTGALTGLCPSCLLAQGAVTEDAPRRGRFEPPSLEEVAKLFPQLEFVCLLGAGGMGAVYKARQPALDRLVALKILPHQEDSGRGNFTDRFGREARALARLNHPNIVAVYEFGQVSGLHFFIMEFVDGANLRQLEAGGRLSSREALQIIPQICDALQYAHDEGVVHRDIKPENVLLDRKGRVKIADFGLAKILGTDPGSLRLTAEGQIMGTPHYMAPEQVEHPLSVDHRADIYALGVVFYEMLTGDLPLGKFAPPSRKVQVDVRLDEVVLRALENDPERRYQQVGEVKTQVENITSTTAPTPEVKGEPSHSPAQPARSLPGTGMPPGMRRNGAREISVIAVLAALALVLGLFAAGFVTLRSITGSFFQASAPAAQLAVVDPASGDLIATLPDGGRVELLAISDENAASNGWWRPDGSAITDTAISVRHVGRALSTGTVNKDMILRLAGLPNGASGPVLEFDPPAGASVGGEVLWDGKILVNGWPARVAWPAESRSGTVRVGLGLEPWRTVTTHHLSGRTVSHSSRPGDPKWVANLHQVSDTDNGVQATLVFESEPKGWKVRLVAFDANGVEHSYSRASGTPSDKSATWTYSFHGLKSEAVKEFQVQVQPLHWLEFRNVALQPASPGPVPQPLRFGLVRKAEFTGGIDLDTGETMNSTSGVEELPSDTKLDLVAGVYLKTIGLRVVVFEPSAWDTLSPFELEMRLGGSEYFPTALKLTENDRIPDGLRIDADKTKWMVDAETPVFGFQTRDGTVGLLRIEAMALGRAAAKIEFRTLVRTTLSR
jgi:predicted Ser/Thr protein kinase